MTTETDWGTGAGFFNPDWRVCPGEILKEVMDERQISREELAKRLDEPIEIVDALIAGELALSPAFALKLEHALSVSACLGISATFWNNLEREYRRPRDAKQ